jgi:hypothetical protein
LDVAGCGHTLLLFLAYLFAFPDSYTYGAGVFHKERLVDTLFGTTSPLRAAACTAAPFTFD